MIRSAACTMLEDLTYVLVIESRIEQWPLMAFNRDKPVSRLEKNQFHLLRG